VLHDFTSEGYSKHKELKYVSDLYG